MSFKNFIRNRMDMLLSKEDLVVPIRRYADIDIKDRLSQQRIKELGWDVIAQVATATDTRLEFKEKFVHELVLAYRKLIDLILLVDMPLDALFPQGRWELEDLYDIEEGDAEDYQVSAYAVVESTMLALRTFKSELDENTLHYFLDLAHHALVRWANKENIKPEELLV